jgi:hypothetical protein
VTIKCNHKFKAVVIKHCSAGNDAVGEMWKETKIFELSDSIEKVFNWASNKYDYKNNGYKGCLELTITKVEEAESD